LLTAEYKVLSKGCDKLKEEFEAISNEVSASASVAVEQPSCITLLQPATINSIDVTTLM
jgi:hypothetical protein